MNENENFENSTWYSSGANDFYYRTAKAPAPAPKGSKTTKIILIAVFAAILVTAVIMVAFSDAKTPPITHSWQAYLDEYYAPEEYEEEIILDKIPYEGDYSMSLETNAGLSELSYQQIYEKCVPSTVYIMAVSKDGYRGSLGSGVIMSSDGLILTNAHIIEGCTNVTVTLSDDREFSARLVGADAAGDICILKIDADGLIPAVFGSSDELSVGDEVAAIGNPLGENFKGTMTNGIVSSISRDVLYNGNYINVIQTNAAINAGSSGGCLVDIYGRVVGITNMKMNSSDYMVEGMAFAIPTATIKDTVDRLLSDAPAPTPKPSGPALGITCGGIPAGFAAEFELPDGVYVISVSDRSDAKAQGVKPGDIITAINGKAITENDDVTASKEGLNVGDSLTLTIWRDSKTFDVTIKLVDYSDI